jgi:hypothetical protein
VLDKFECGLAVVRSRRRCRKDGDRRLFNGLAPLSSLQHDLLAHALNERLDEIAPPRAPYADELPQDNPLAPAEKSDIEQDDTDGTCDQDTPRH